MFKLEYIFNLFILLFFDANFSLVALAQLII
jgi:hypothetical protein